LWFCILPFAGLLPAAPLHGQGAVVVRLEAEPETDWSNPGFWETLDGQPAELSWQFEAGEIRLVRPRGGSGSLLSGPLPSDFELAWKWKLEQGTNSGIKYRVQKFGSRWLGLEYQLIDEPKRTDSKGSTASIYDLSPPCKDKPLHPAGQWNASRIVAVGDRIDHFLNGTLVASVESQGPQWEAMIAKSKFWGLENFGRPVEGQRVMLTDHGGKIVYKDFRFVIREAPPATVSAQQGPYLGNGIRNGWADQDSIVIWTRTTQQPDMNREGPNFLAVSAEQQQRLNRSADEAECLTAQLPEGATLDRMFGACPGERGEVRLSYFPEKQSKLITTTEWKVTSADEDFTAQWQLEDLRPGRHYAVVVEARPLGAKRVSAIVRGRFRTAPAANQSQPIRFCVTTCHDFIRRDDGLSGHKIYPSMQQLDPDFVVHAGDIEYYDKPDPWAWTIDLMRFKWARIFSLPNNRNFYTRTTSYFLKDDHDTLKNDCWPGQTYGAVRFEQGARLFNEEQFPSHRPRYKTVRWGRDVQIWLLEGRDFRSPNKMPDGPNKTILGAEQREWLLDTLEDSSARFKLVFSPTPIVGPDRANKRDNHANDTFAYEGQRLRQELSKRLGVIVFCGDRHWQYASVDAETGLWEFGCGPGSEKHQLGWKQGDERPVHRFLRVAGGFLSGELAYDRQHPPAPRLTLRHRKVTGEVVSEFTFPPSPKTDGTTRHPQDAPAIEQP
jgi:alkaline phosphatase D